MKSIQAARWILCANMVVFGLPGLPSAAQGPRAGNVDYAQLRTSVQTFEQGLNFTVNGTFGTLSMIGKPKGAFVPGTGYVFSFLVNMRWGETVNSPMGSFSRGPAPSPATRKKRIDDMKEGVLRLLIGQGAAMPMLEKDKSIIVIAYIEEHAPEGDMNKTIVMSVLKSDLDELGTRQERQNELKQRVKIVEY
jgi:hypothetical protein